MDNREYNGMPNLLHGRKRIVSSSMDLSDSEEARKVLDVALSNHGVNNAAISFLYDYYRGIQPILDREKSVREDICNKIVENRASEIVSFKVGYVFGEPVQYTSRKDDSSEKIQMLNNFMFSESKHSKDRDLGEWQAICGTSYRLVLPDKSAEPNRESDDAPFEIYTLDPRDTFVIYSSDYTHRPLAGVTFTFDERHNMTYDMYTENKHYRWENATLIMEENHILGRVPIIEYPANNARMGSFEVVLPLLDAINTLQSNRVDSVEQFVQSLMKFVNCDIDEEGFEKMKKLGAIKLRSTSDMPADVAYLDSEISQSETQVFVDYLYQTVLTICGMPNRNGNGSTSDTGAAVIMRDGWELAESRAKDTELMFKQSEQDFLRIVIEICNTLRPNIDLNFYDIDIRFTRRNYEAVQSKSQVLSTLLALDKVDPIDAFTSCGLFVDSEAAYKRGMDWYESQKEKNMEFTEQTFNNNNTEEDIVEERDA